MKNLAGFNPKLIFYAHGGVGRDPAKLIAKAAENTRVFGDIVLKALKEGKNTDEIRRLLENYIFTQAHVKPEIMEILLMVEAYIYYFKRKGLI